MDFLRKIVSPLRLKTVRLAIAGLVAVYLGVFGFDVTEGAAYQWITVAAIAIASWAGDGPATS